MPTPERIVSVLRLPRSKRFRAPPCAGLRGRGPVEVEDLPGLARLKIGVVRRPARAGPRSAAGSARSRSRPAGLAGFVGPSASRLSLCRPSAFGFSSALVGRLLLVALARQRRGDARAEHDQVDRTPHAHVLGRLREPLVDRAGVGRGEEVEVLAAGVEDRIGRVAQPVGDRPRPAGLQIVGVDGVIPGPIDQGVDDPAGVGRPGGAGHDRLVRPKDRRRGDLLDLPAAQVDPDTATPSCRCRRSCGCRATRRGSGRSRPRGDRRPSAGPCRRPGGRGAGIRPLRPRTRRSSGRRATRPGERSFTPGDSVRLRGSPFSAGTVTISPRYSNTARAPRGRNVGVADVLGRALDVSRPRVGQVAGHADLQPRARSRWPDRTDTDSPPARRSAGRRPRPTLRTGKSLVRGQLPDGLRLGVVGEQVVLAVAVRAEIDRPADPVRIEIVGAVRRAAESRRRDDRRGDRSRFASACRRGSASTAPSGRPAACRRSAGRRASSRPATACGIDSCVGIPPANGTVNSWL